MLSIQNKMPCLCFPLRHLLFTMFDAKWFYQETLAYYWATFVIPILQLKTTEQNHFSLHSIIIKAFLPTQISSMLYLRNLEKGI